MSIFTPKVSSTQDNQKSTESPVQSEKVVHSKNTKLMLFLVLISLLAVAGTGYLSFQKSAIVSQQSQIDGQITNLQKELSTLKKDNIEGSQSAADALKEIEKNELRWSGIINAVQELVPYDSATKKPKINFLSYSGSADGKLTLSAVTNESSLPLFGDVAELIAVFNNSNFFKDAYVPSLSQGTSENGGTTLSFVFNVNYQEPTLENVEKFSIDESNTKSSNSSEEVSDPASASTENGSTVTSTTSSENNVSSVDNASGKTPRVPTKK